MISNDQEACDPLQQLDYIYVDYRQYILHFSCSSVKIHSKKCNLYNSLDLENFM